MEYEKQLEADYAVVTVFDPFQNPFERIPNAYKRIMEYLQANNFRESPQDNILSCFEYVYEKDGVQRMDVYIHVKGVTKADAFTRFD